MTREQTVTLEAKLACAIAMVKFIGIQPMYGVRPDQILFQPLDGFCKGSTLAVPVGSDERAISYRLSVANGQAIAQAAA